MLNFVVWLGQHRAVCTYATGGEKVMCPQSADAKKKTADAITVGQNNLQSSCHPHGQPEELNAKKHDITNDELMIAHLLPTTKALHSEMSLANKGCENSKNRSFYHWWGSIIFRGQLINNKRH